MITRLILLTLITVSALAQSLTITGPASARPGASIPIQYNLTGPASAVQWRETITAASSSNQAPGPSVIFQCNTDPSKLCLAASLTQQALAGAFGTATLTIQDPTTENSASVVLSAIVASLPDGTATPVTAGAPYVVTILAWEDVDGDQDIDMQDILQSIAQIFGACTTADVNRDGSCNVLDLARVIFRAIL